MQTSEGKAQGEKKGMNWYLEALRKYAVFEGRARRKEYWYFALFNVIILIVLLVIDRMTGTFNPEVGVGLFGAIYLLGLLIPSLAVAVRRLHDTNRSGWWMLLGLIPLVGALCAYPGCGRHRVSLNHLVYDHVYAPSPPLI